MRYAVTFLVLVNILSSVCAGDIEIISIPRSEREQAEFFPSNEEEVALQSVLTKSIDAVFMLSAGRGSTPGGDYMGTGFNIAVCKKNADGSSDMSKRGLLVTNRHVLEKHMGKFLFGTCANGQYSTPIQSENIWFHPDEDVDLALMKTSPIENAILLPPKKASCGGMFLNAVGTIGFPGLWSAHDHLNPRLARSTGVIHQFDNIFCSDGKKPWSVRTNLCTWPGMSGSPVITESGVLAGVEATVRSHQIGRPVFSTGVVRVDAIWDFVDSLHEQLKDVEIAVGKGFPFEQPYREHRSTRYVATPAEAIALVNGSRAYTGKNLPEAIRFYDEALRNTPPWPRAFYERARAYGELARNTFNANHSQQAVHYAERACEDALKAAGLEGSSVECWELVVEQFAILGKVSGNANVLEAVRYIAHREVEQGVPSTRSSALYARGLAELYAGNAQGALRSANSAIELNAQYAKAFSLRAKAERQLQQTAAAIRDEKTAEHLEFHTLLTLR